MVSILFTNIAQIDLVVVLDYISQTILSLNFVLTFDDIDMWNLYLSRSRDLKGKILLLALFTGHLIRELVTLCHKTMNCYRKSQEKTKCFIMGDFNMDLINFQHHHTTGEFLDGLHWNMFFPMITRPSRITSHTATLLDNIFITLF